ncbi:MAG: DUF4861 family protein [Candidatus Cryptobacteroides sp.]
MRRILNILAAASAAAILVSCTSGAIKVRITNDSELSRTAETIELSFDALVKSCPELNAKNVVVTDNSGKQIPSQVFCAPDKEPVLLFQADVPSGKSLTYRISVGEREDYPIRAYSRYVPERLDDYAWENDLVVGRLYGPALEAPRTCGYDIWLKCTDRLIIDEWFRKMDFHRNHGDGLDCYLVGKTLGGGAFVPAIGGHLCIGDNYATQEHICDGPIRTSARFTNETVDIEGTPVTIIREMSLDAGSRFVKWVTVFEAPTAEIPAALGAIMHSVIAREDGANYISFTELASDSRDSASDGNISIGLVMSPDAKITGTGDMDGHAVILATVPTGEETTTWIGSGWSLGGVATPEDWAAEVKNFAYSIANPLKVEIL